MAYQTAEKIAAASGFTDPIAASLPKLPPGPKTSGPLQGDLSDIIGVFGGCDCFGAGLLPERLEL